MQAMLSIVQAQYETRPGSHTMETSRFLIGAGAEHPARHVEVKTLDGLRAQVGSYGTEVAAALPDLSFRVYVRVAKGSRKLPGFDAMERADYFGGKAWMRTVAREV